MFPTLPPEITFYQEVVRICDAHPGWLFVFCLSIFLMISRALNRSRY